MIKSAIAFYKILAQIRDVFQRVVKEIPLVESVKFYVIGLTSQLSLPPNQEISAILQRRSLINQTTSLHTPVTSLPYVGGQLSLKVTTGNVDET